MSMSREAHLQIFKKIKRNVVSIVNETCDETYYLFRYCGKICNKKRMEQRKRQRADEGLRCASIDLDETLKTWLSFEDYYEDQTIVIELSDGADGVEELKLVCHYDVSPKTKARSKDCLRSLVLKELHPSTKAQLAIELLEQSDVFDVLVVDPNIGRTMRRLLDKRDGWQPLLADNDYYVYSWNMEMEEA